MGLTYRGVNKGLYVLLIRTQAGLGRTVKQEQEEISRNHVQTFIYTSLQDLFGLGRMAPYYTMASRNRDVEDVSASTVHTIP